MLETRLDRSHLDSVPQGSRHARFRRQSLLRMLDV